MKKSLIGGVRAWSEQKVAVAQRCPFGTTALDTRTSACTTTLSQSVFLMLFKPTNPGEVNKCLERSNRRPNGAILRDDKYLGCM